MTVPNGSAAVLPCVHAMVFNTVQIIARGPKIKKNEMICLQNVLTNELISPKLAGSNLVLEWQQVQCSRPSFAH